MRFLLLFLLIVFSFEAKSQTNNITDSLLISTFSDFTYEKVPYRSVMKVKKQHLLQQLNPLQYLSSGLMFAYQRVISHQLQAECTYKISCSQYTKLSIEEYGLLKGALLGFYQLQSCFSHNHLDYPSYKIGLNGQIKNQIGLED